MCAQRVSDESVSNGEVAPAGESKVLLVKADKALLSLRSSGHDFCSAVGEVIDNSLEAGANVVRIRLFTGQRKPPGSKRAVPVIERVAVGDDGCGMGRDDLHQALQLGFSTRYNSRLGMGRFGVGAKLGGISQARCLSMISRESADEPWLGTRIDLEEIEQGKDVIDNPAECEIPEDCEDLVGEDRGTLVVWSKTDHLQEKETGGARQATSLKGELVDYLARTFRRFLDGGKQIWVDDIRVLPHDPLFLMNSTRFHQVPEKINVKLAEFPRGLKFPKACADKIFYDKDSQQLTYRGAMAVEHRDLLRGLAELDDFERCLAEDLGRVPSANELQGYADSYRGAIDDLHRRSNPDPVATVLHTASFDFDVPGRPGQTSPVEVTVTLLPEAFWEREKSTDRPGGTPFARDRRIDENEGVSILRAGREIFHGYLRDVQPAIKEIDRFIGIEIRFRPDLDECFKVRNVKRGAEPVNGLRDRLSREIFNTVETARKQIKGSYARIKAKNAQNSGAHAQAEEIVASAKDFAPKQRAGEEVSPEARAQKVDDAAQVLTQGEPHRKPEVAKAILERPVTVVPQAWPGSDFMQIDHLGTTAIVRLNTQHPFYTEVYGKLIEATQPGADSAVAGFARTIQVGLDLLLLSYAQAEGVEKNADEKYQNLRTYWGVNLKNNVQQWVRGKAE